MLYLSKVNLNDLKSLNWRGPLMLHNANHTHRLTMSLFPKAQTESPREEFGVLYLVQPPSAKQASCIYIQSKIPPSNPYVKVADFSKYLETLSEGQQINIDVRFNNIKTVDTPQGTKRKSLSRDETTLKIAALFDPILSNSSILLPSYGKYFYKSNAPIYYANLNVSGVLKNKKELEHLVSEGIGRSKAYGCGMLRVTT